MTTCFIINTNVSSTDNAIVDLQALTAIVYDMELIEANELKPPKIKVRTPPNRYSPKTPYKNWNGRSMNEQ